MALWFLLLVGLPLWAARPFEDLTHSSKVFGEQRHFRLLLPAGYETGTRRYPVIYYFHGHSDRYTVEKYDNGKDTIPKIADFVAKNPVIVVSVDGYVAKEYQGFYGGEPWDIREGGGDYDFGEYFKELVAHIDANYRTLTSRRFRATSGLSMGGFMSLWLSARYPHLIGSASSFNPGPEFYTGDKGSRILWRPKDHTANHEHTKIRLIRASGDYISQYHEETRAAYARASKVDFEFRQDEHHRHWATSIGESFEFHNRAFADSALDNVPVSFSHDDPHKSFEVWGYRVETEGSDPGITMLENVTQGSLRIRTRRWAPDGPATNRSITVTTAPLYQGGSNYEMFDHFMRFMRRPPITIRSTVKADPSGRLTFTVDGTGHQISFSGPGTGAEPPLLLPLDPVYVAPDQTVSLPIRIYNPRGKAMDAVKAELTTEYPTISIVNGNAELKTIQRGVARDLSSQMRIRLTSADGYFEPTRLKLKLTFDGYHSVTEDIDIYAIPSVIPKALAVEIFDGRKATLPVFLQKGNQGGGSLVPREIQEGKGNGNGILEPGEEATVWVQLEQGVDAFDKGSWHRARVRQLPSFLEETALIEEQKQREWTSAKSRTSVIRLAAEAPRGKSIPLLLDFESWSFHWTPDVRYGVENLYQAFQIHRPQLARWELKLP